MTMTATMTETPHDAQPGPMALPAIHDHLMDLIQRESPPPCDIVDIGAGQGAISARLLEAGYRVSACDLFPEMFRAKGIECRQVDATGALPFEDESLDVAIAVEVVEHLESHRPLFSEAARVLRPGGAFIFTTPNINSLKSRWRFLTTGYFYSFGPLDPAVDDPVRQHIAPFTVDRYRFLLGRCGLTLSNVETDKYQTSSKSLSWLSPFIRWSARRAWGDDPGVRLQNGKAALLGRTLMVVARKPEKP